MKNGVERKRAKVKRRTRRVEASSGNVFKDLGFPNPQEELAKADLAIRISQLIAAQKLTQKKAAAVLGIDQPKVSALLRGKLDGFSTERLLRFINRLGQDVEISIRPAHGAHPCTRIMSEDQPSA
jgi:predicted XRE-type DNA-binding protein